MLKNGWPRWQIKTIGARGPNLNLRSRGTKSMGRGGKHLGGVSCICWDVLWQCQGGGNASSASKKKAEKSTLWEENAQKCEKSEGKSARITKRKNCPKASKKGTKIKEITWKNERNFSFKKSRFSKKITKNCKNAPKMQKKNWENCAKKQKKKSCWKSKNMPQNAKKTCETHSPLTMPPAALKSKQGTFSHQNTFYTPLYWDDKKTGNLLELKKEKTTFCFTRCLTNANLISWHRGSRSSPLEDGDSGVETVNRRWRGGCARLPATWSPIHPNPRREVLGSGWQMTYRQTGMSRSAGLFSCTLHR